MIQDIIVKTMGSMIPILLGLFGLYKLILEQIKAGTEKAKLRADADAGCRELSKRIDSHQVLINELSNDRDRRKIEEERIMMLIGNIKENYEAIKKIIGRYSRQKTETL